VSYRLADPQGGGQSARRHWPRAWVNVKPSRIGSLRRLFEVYARCARERRPMSAAAWVSWAWAAGRSSCLAAVFHADAPTTSGA
jgi:hypothetical protein